jgi:hypothetical protein
MDKSDAIMPETDENPPNQERFYSKLKEAANLVINPGVDPKAALTLTKGKIPADATLSRFKSKLEKYSLTRPAMVKLAHNAIRETLQMKPVTLQDGKELIPSHTNRLAAAQMIADRIEPIIRVNQNMNINVDLDPVDMSKYGNKRDD